MNEIINFTSIDSLFEEIKKDSNNKCILCNRYPVRFILLDNFTLFDELISRFSKELILTFNTESLIDKNDNWITKDKLIETIKKLDENVVIYPVSELVRFYNDDKFKSFFEEMSILETNGSNRKKRIYIPLIGLEHRFKNFLSKYGRIKESQPIWSLLDSTNQQTVKVFLVPDEIASKSNLNCIKTVKDWLKFWRTFAPTEKIICSSETINTYSKNSKSDNIFQFVQIENSYQFIYTLLDLNIEIDYIENENKYWSCLLDDISKCKLRDFSFKKFVNKHFNTYELEIKDILNIWTDAKNTDYYRWLLKHYYIKFLNNNNYLNTIIENCNDYSNKYLFQQIALNIFVSINEKRKYFQERNELLLLFEEHHKLPDYDLRILEEKIKSISKNNYETAFALCSGKFDFEKELFIGWYKVGKLSIYDLKRLYPDLANYLSDINYDSWVNSYIQEYKKAKVEDKFTDSIKEFINEINVNEDSFYKWYHQFTKSKLLLENEKPDKIYWLDGVGIEYLSLILALIKESSDFEIEKCEIASTNIPSSTLHNRFENVIKKDDLDKYIHSEAYKYPISISNGIEIVKNMVLDILNQSKEMSIAIVSDHGLTFLSRLVDSKKYSEKSSHEGRYIELENGDSIEDRDYIRHENDGKYYKVALNHASLNTKPIREVHGGCTPEEVLVPFILISNRGNNREVIIVDQEIDEPQTPLIGNKEMKGYTEVELF
ncbi:MAG: BREX-4 system phosphatase PglZ [Bacteroidales bacterium]|nr:BREX-4 system phosphatase PglZ [Bacteroidales bacterium]